MALMSASSPSQAGPRYRRTTGGLVTAMVVTVLVVLAFVAFRGLFRENKPTPVRTVDYARSLDFGREEGRLAMLAPDRLPRGWRATSASYTRDPSPAWHLGVLTDQEEYVGLEEGRDSPAEMARQHVDVDARRDGTVRIAGERWQVWRDSGGDYAVIRSLPGPERVRETVLVVGSAPEQQVRAFAARLRTG